MAGYIEVGEVSAFDDAATQMQSVADGFHDGMRATAGQSASPAAAGTMPEGQTFMQNERQARELLVQYLSKTSDGLSGYQTAIGQLGREHHGLVALNSQRLKALLLPHDGPVRNDPIFNWQNVLDQQNGGR